MFTIRSTPGSLDLSRLKSEESPPTLLKTGRFFSDESEKDEANDEDIKAKVEKEEEESLLLSEASAASCCAC